VDQVLGLPGRDVGLLGVCIVLAIAAGLLDAHPVGRVLPFVIAALALAALATLVGRCVDALGDRLGAGATGVVQSALGNLPELFVCVFALRAGLDNVVRAAIVGSVLANVLLVLGLAFLVGGLKNGTQRFDSERARSVSLLLLLAVAGLLVPSLTFALHTPAAGHEVGFSRVAAVLLLLLFALSLPAALGRGSSENVSSEDADQQDSDGDLREWPLWLSLGLLAASGVGAAFVSDWFVAALSPAVAALHLSQAFAGLVIVAIAGNAIENVVGIQLAYRNQADFAMSVIIQSPLQIALVLAPALVLLSLFTATTLTLVFAPMLVVAVAVTVIAVAFIVFDGESTWLEGATLIALYAIIATAFWWG
jgi:Ca2+:H+ antiporter